MKTRKTYFRLLGYLRPYWKRLIVSVALTLVLSGSFPLLGLLVKDVVDDIFIAKNITMLKFMPALIIGIFLIRVLCDYFSYYLMTDVGQRIIMDIRDDLYAHIQTLSMPYFIKTPTGVLISRITNDVNMVQSSVTNSVTGLARHSLTLIGLVIAAFYRNWELALISMVVFPLVIYPINRFGQRLKHFSQKSMKVMGDVMSILDEAISGIRIVKAYNMEDYEVKRFSKENRRYYRNWMRRIAIRAISGPMLEFIGGIATSFLVWYGGMKVMNGILTPGEFFSFITLLSLLYAPIRKLNTVNIDVQEGIAAANRVFEILDLDPEVSQKPDAKPLSRENGEFEYRNVSFTYTGEEYALTDISFHAKKGMQIALVGESGSGKTTIANLLPRFFDVTNGQILIDGLDIRDVTLRSLRDSIALVTQDMVLFNDTIRSNIAYGTETAAMEQIIKASESANAHDFIMGMPDGYDTIIGEAGVRLSGGQRQRICIARAIIKDAPILILDEATSALDTESEREVQAAMDRLMQGRTSLVIAHRLSTILNADWIMVLNKGRIMEQGTHRQLLAENGYYSKLYNLQFADA